MRFCFWLFCLAILAASPSPAWAEADVTAPVEVTSRSPAPLVVVERTPVYGAKGQWLLGGTSHLTIAGGHYARRSILSVLPENLFGFSFAPSIAYFVAPHAALGLTSDITVTRAPGTTAWSLAIGPQAHAYIYLARHVGLLPGLAFLYRRAEADDTLLLAFKVTAAIHLNDKVSLSVGPQVSQDVWRHRAPLRVTNYGLYVGVIGWL